MINVTVSVDTSKFDRMLSDIPGAALRARRNALGVIGTLVASVSTRAFRAPELRPAAWAPRKPSKNDDGHPLLIKSGNMRQSISRKIVGDDTVVIGTPAKYASYHQQGTRHMPARPFFPVDANGQLLKTVKEQITQKVQEAYQAELGKLGGRG